MIQLGACSMDSMNSFTYANGALDSSLDRFHSVLLSGVIGAIPSSAYGVSA